MKSCVLNQLNEDMEKGNYADLAPIQNFLHVDVDLACADLTSISIWLSSHFLSRAMRSLFGVLRSWVSIFPFSVRILSSLRSLSTTAGSSEARLSLFLQKINFYFKSV